MMKGSMILALVVVVGLVGQAVAAPGPEEDQVTALLKMDTQKLDRFRQSVQMLMDSVTPSTQSDDQASSFYERAVGHYFAYTSKADQDKIKEICSEVAKLDELEGSGFVKAREFYKLCAVVNSIQMGN